MKKFFGVIGNPPYQEEQDGDNANYSPSVYNHFMDSAYQVADRVELIHPARFLFHSGNTPKDWNEKILKDPHFKILEYENDSQKIFHGISITGGIAISYRDANENFGAIETFMPYDELKAIKNKVLQHEDYTTIKEQIYIQTRFNLDELYKEHPETKQKLGSSGKDNRFEKNIFQKTDLFTREKLNDDDIRTLGIDDRKRAWRFIPRRYVLNEDSNLDFYKVIMSVANGAAGTISEEPAKICGEPLIGNKGDGYTRTFLSIGRFESVEEANNCAKYLRTKFARTLLGTLKLTQMINKDVWTNVPLQDFTSSSDIDWSQSVYEIDVQLYQKYGLSDDEIEFIETHVKEMD